MGLFKSRLGKKYVYFLWNPLDNKIAQCDDKGRRIISKWLAITPQKFVKIFWNGRPVSALSKIVVNRRFITKFKRECFRLFHLYLRATYSVSDCMLAGQRFSSMSRSHLMCRRTPFAVPLASRFLRRMVLESCAVPAVPAQRPLLVQQSTSNPRAPPPASAAHVAPPLRNLQPFPPNRQHAPAHIAMMPMLLLSALVARRGARGKRV